MAMKYAAENIGALVKQARKRLGVTQRSLALTSGTGLRFIIDLEKGKDTCQLGKVLTVLHTLGITMNLSLPSRNLPGEVFAKDAGIGDFLRRTMAKQNDFR